jgi:lipoprotein-anchoring transpeptidase ErfK/SrfK
MDVSEGWVKSFARRYGWRAYALPILAAITIVALVGTAPSHADSPSRSAGSSTDHVAAHDAASGTTEVKQGTDAGYAPAATPKPIVISVTNDDDTTCADNGYTQLVVVSIHLQHLWACDGHRQVDSTPVTTGETDNGDQTPLGSWRVQAKQRDRYLVGPGYRDYVKYWVPFNGDFGFHDASWQTMPFGSQGYHAHGSHGCVHLPTATMAWFYKWATVYQTVVTIEA